MSSPTSPTTLDRTPSRSAAHGTVLPWRSLASLGIDAGAAAGEADGPLLLTGESPPEAGAGEAPGALAA
ncbi:hypothetical protein [Streptomyces sp. NPDC001985]|uniref:hypothetical protein n=1 Tax=Streptomyces sp. NPDC001985 TaxID=3154406 RepID=UPI00332622A2